MNAFSMLCFRDVAIRAEHLEAWWEPLVDKPSVEPGTTLDVSEDSTAMLVSMAFDMIDGKEVTLRFAAASTFRLAPRIMG
jgi:hypothetical protein